MAMELSIQAEVPEERTMQGKEIHCLKPVADPEYC